MIASGTKAQESIPVRVWEFNVLILEGILAGAVLMVAVVVGGPRVLGGLVGLPVVAWMGAGLFTLLWALYPPINALSRARYGHGVPAWRYLIGSVSGAVIGPTLFALLS